MLKQYTKYFAMLLLVTLQACGGGSGGSSGSSYSSADVSSDSESLYRQGIDAMKNGRDKEAIHFFTAVTQKNPDLAGAYINLGILYTNNKRYDDALKAMLQATTLKPNDAVAYNQLGVVYRHLGKPKEAEAAYLQALQNDSDYALAHYNIGILYDVYFNQLAKAKKHYEKYQSIIGTADSQVAKWLEDINFRMKNNKQR